MKKTLGLLVLLLVAPELSSAPQVRTILVFPFENQSTRAELGWIAESFAEILSSRLGTPDSYVLSREERNAAYERLGLPLGTPLTLASVYKLAESLAADWAVVGNFAVEGERLVARSRLLDLGRMRLSSTLEASGELADLVDLQTRLAWRLLATHDTRFTAGKEEDFRRRFPEVRLDAFENYIRGIAAADGETRVGFLREADRLNPRDLKAAFELGRYYFEQKDYANSAKWFRKIDEKDPNYVEGTFLLGVDEFFLGNEAAAEKHFAALGKEFPLKEVWNNLGVMKTRRGRYAEALTDFERAYQGEPADQDFGFNMAACLWYLKRDEEAARVLGKALRLAEEDAELRVLLAMVLARRGDSEGYRRELQWLADHEGSPERLTDLAGDFMPQTRLKKNFDGRAYRIYSLGVRNAIEERPAVEPAAGRAEVRLVTGKKLLAEGRLAEAERELVQAVSLAPRESEGRLALAQLYEAQGRNREALSELETSLQNANNAMTHLRLARVYLELNRVQAAHDHGQAALRLDPDNGEARRLIDQIRERASSTGKSP